MRRNRIVNVIGAAAVCVGFVIVAKADPRHGEQGRHLERPRGTPVWLPGELYFWYRLRIEGLLSDTPRYSEEHAPPGDVVPGGGPPGGGPCPGGC